MAKEIKMKYYELTYLTSQDMSEEAAKQLLDKFAAMIVSGQGIVVDSQKAYKKRLAYPVKKQQMALVNSIRFQMESAPVVAFNDEIKKDALVLRSLIVTYVPQPIRQMREPIIQAPVAEQSAAKEPVAVATAEAKIEAVEEKREVEIKAPEKPKARREKAKADLKEIGEKLDEILND
jgi:ribosomal protein S6